VGGEPVAVVVRKKGLFAADGGRGQYCVCCDEEPATTQRVVSLVASAVHRRQVVSGCNDGWVAGLGSGEAGMACRDALIGRGARRLRQVSVLPSPS
jgi:hypothetical protein